MQIIETEPAGLSNSAISTYAERIGAHHRIYDEMGRADLIQLLDVLGGQLAYAESEESLSVRGVGDFTVYVPQYTSHSRDRFTIAHEIGHYFLHYRYADVTGLKQFGRGARNRAETEASVFASALLMPEDSFRAAWKEVGGDVWRAADRFMVSTAAVDVRASALNLR